METNINTNLSDLEEAADCYKDMVMPEDVDDYEHAYFYETYTEYQIADAFKAGAKWQKEKDFQYVKKECERTGSCCDNDIAIEATKRHPYYYVSEMEAYANIGFKEGAMWQKKQLMANATEVTVHIDAGGYPYIPQMELYDYDEDIPLAKEGDKYKVVLIKEDCKEKPVSEDLKKAAKVYKQTRNDLDVVSDNQMVERAFKAGAQWKEKQMMKDAVDACVTDIRTYKEENEVDFTVMYEKGIIPYEIEQEVKLIIIKED